MKQKIHIFVLCLTVANLASASANTIAQWTFESSAPTTSGPLSPEWGSGIGTAFHNDGATAYSNPAGNGSTESWSANHWNAGDYFQFQVSTLGYKDILVSWDQYRSSSAPASWDFTYSLNGTDYAVAKDNYSPSASSWSSGSSFASGQLSMIFSGLSGLENATSVYFRIVADASASLTSGASRIDNFTVTATPTTHNVPATSPGIFGLSCLLVLLVFYKRNCFSPETSKSEML